MKRMVVVLLMGVLSTVAHADRWQPSDRLRIANLNDPQISPDGKSVAVVVARANVKENRWDGDLVLFDTATGEQHPLTYDRRGVAAPRWSPDGSQLAFLANGSTDREAERQILLLPSHGRETHRLTDARPGAAADAGG